MKSRNAFTAIAGDRSPLKRLLDDAYSAELLVIPGGKRAYLWIGVAGGPCFATLSGQKTLACLAHAILDQVEPQKKKRGPSR